MKIKTRDQVIIIGQHLTSRTEAVRDYLKKKVQGVSVISLGSYAVSKKENHAFYYEKGILKQHHIFPHKILKKTNFYPLLILFTLFFYFLDIVRSLILFKKKFAVCIGISHFSGLIAIILKLLKICKKSIYYTIDYYAPHKKEDYNKPYAGVNWFDQILLKMFNYIDKLTVKYADAVWDISPRIKNARLKFGRIKKEKYQEKRKIVPLGYSPAFFRNQTVNKINRFSIVFAGVVVESQGLELILEVLPALRKIMPKIKIRVIGTGPFLPRFKTLVYKKKLASYFKFYGFVEEVNKMLEIIASSAVGISLWNPKALILNAFYGDPGKTKLYSVCGLPVVTSNFTVYSQIIKKNKAGMAINYDTKELFKALKKILLKDKDYGQYKKRAILVAKKFCNSEKIFNQALKVES